MNADSAARFVLALVEPTRLRVLNCVAAAPLFVTDLADVLDLPLSDVSEHLRVLHELGVVHATSLPPRMLYHLEPGGTHEQLVRVLLAALRVSAPYDEERKRARDVSRGDPAARPAPSAAGAHAP